MKPLSDTAHLARCEFCFTYDDVELIWGPIHTCLPCWDKMSDKDKKGWQKIGERL